MQNNLAIALRKQGKHEEAEKLQRSILDRSVHALGETHPNTLTGLSNLAMVLQYQGKHAEAEEHSRKVLELSKKTLGPDILDTLGCY